MKISEVFLSDVKMNPNQVQFKENRKMYFNPRNDFHVHYCIGRNIIAKLIKI